MYSLNVLPAECNSLDKEGIRFSYTDHFSGDEGLVMKISFNSQRELYEAKKVLGKDLWEGKQDLEFGDMVYFSDEDYGARIGFLSEEFEEVVLVVNSKGKEYVEKSSIIMVNGNNPGTVERTNEYLMQFESLLEQVV